MISEYIPISGLATFLILSVYSLNRQIAKRPTFIDTDVRYKKIEVCDEIHKNISEKLECIPEVKDTLARLETKVDILLKENGK